MNNDQQSLTAEGMELTLEHVQAFINENEDAKRWLSSEKDKFFSKSRICPAKPIEKVRQDMSRFGNGTIARFDELTKLFGTP